jgi:type VI protein secretion system component Hcp
MSAVSTPFLDPPAPSAEGEVAAGGAAARPTPGGERFYVRIVGARQGAFAGDATDAARAGWLTGVAFAQVAASPRDIASGTAAGAPRAGQIEVTLRWGAASPQLFTALYENESLTSVVCEFLHAGAAAGQPFQRLTISDASVAGLRRAAGDRPSLETVSLLAGKIVLEDLAHRRSSTAETPLVVHEVGEEQGEAGGVAPATGWRTDLYDVGRARLDPCVRTQVA